ncbi:MAG: hypothetical protein HUU55_11945 [Myxococcales bacterium]|nr:hypothetical protein [Myxococcales bacterium]
MRWFWTLVAVLCVACSSDGDGVVPVGASGSNDPGQPGLVGYGTGSGGGGSGNATGNNDSGSTGGGGGQFGGGEGTPSADAGDPDPRKNPCVDNDGDNHGKACVAGPDCDDTNPYFTDECPDCTTANHAGCPCDPSGQTSYCYGADPALNGIGNCKLGQRTCVDGYWTGCLGEVLPEDEICDGTDNDCDGATDEGVLSVCGNCDKFCAIDTIGAGTNKPFAVDENDSPSVQVTPEGWVTLTESSYAFRFIWIANSAESTVSKLDTDTGKELGRYTVCANPSRTSVDQKGDCWVGCRDDGKVAKIHNIPETCKDFNGDGVIQTSTDANGDGVIQGSEMLPSGQDECVDFVVKPSGDPTVRALGVDSQNHAWIGLWNQSQLMRLEPTAGQVVQTVNIPAQPYGLTIDKSGIIWVSGRGGSLLVRVDPKTNDVSSMSPGGCFEPYGIVADLSGDVWIGNCCCGHFALRYRPSTGEWVSIGTSNRPRGIAAGADGYIYVAIDESNRIAKVDPATNQLLGYAELGSGRFPVGIAVDSKGYVWAVNQSSNSATKIDPTTMTTVFEHPVGAGPYTYSDMTGAAFFQSIAPDGVFNEIYGGWDGVRVIWETLSINADTPPGTYIEVRLRAADSLEELKTAAWSDLQGPFPPKTFPIQLKKVLKKKGDFLQVEIRLVSDGESLKPYVKGISVQYSAEPEE